MINTSTAGSPSFIDGHRQNRRRRYSISSPHVFESRAGTVSHRSKILTEQTSHGNSFASYSTLSESDLLFPTDRNQTEKYDILSKLNVGAFGSTYLIRDSNDGQMYLLKRIDAGLPNPFRQRLLEERRLFSWLKSHYILSLVSSYMDLEHRCFSMKFEYTNGLTLLHLLRRFRWLEEAAVAFYSAQIVLALEYLHEFNVIYRNLKLETTLLTDNGYLKLFDFAFAKLLPTRSSATASIVGVPDIMPPEMLLGQPYSFSVDWWQLGIALFEMLTSQTPFFSPSMMQTHRNVLCHRRHHFPSRISSSAKHICRMLLQPKVCRRLGCSVSGMDAKEVKQNIWFRDHVDWAAIVKRAHPPPYKLSDFQRTSNETMSMSSTIESKWLDEYDQAVRSLTNVSFDENFSELVNL